MFFNGLMNRSKPFRTRTLVSPRHSLQNSDCRGVIDVSDEVFSKMFLRGCVGGCGDFEIELRKIKIREHALKLAERLSETKSSCSLPISVFNMFPDFVIFLVLWSGAEACEHIPAEYVFDNILRLMYFITSTNPDFTFTAASWSRMYYTDSAVHIPTPYWGIPWSLGVWFPG